VALFEKQVVYFEFFVSSQFGGVGGRSGREMETGDGAGSGVAD
jgi:hypothetical protein